MVKLWVFLKLICFLCCTKLKQRAWLYSSISKPSPTWCFRAVLLCDNTSFTPHWHNKPVEIKWNKHQQKSELMGSRCLVILPFKAGWQPRLWLYSLADTGCHQSEENKAWDCKKKQLISELGLEENRQSAPAGLCYSLSSTAVRMEGRNSFPSAWKCWTLKKQNSGNNCGSRVLNKFSKIFL